MQPLAAEIHRDAVSLDGPGAAAGALARFDHEHRDAAIRDETARRGDAGRAGADHRDIDLGRKVCHPDWPLTLSLSPHRGEGTRCAAGHSGPSPRLRGEGPERSEVGEGLFLRRVSR